MSTICLAAQRSYQTGEAVWFSYRLPSLKRILTRALAAVVCLCTLAIAGMYAHIYWDLRHPQPEPKPDPAHAVKPDTQISDMHYVYVSKPFPQPKPAAPVHSDPLPPLAERPIMDNDADWQQAPDGDLSGEPLPGAEAETRNPQTVSLKARFMQALQEQQQDYSQGKVPDDPVDETVDVKKPPRAMTQGDLRFDTQ